VGKEKRESEETFIVENKKIGELLDRKGGKKSKGRKRGRGGKEEKPKLQQGKGGDGKGRRRKG